MKACLSGGMLYRDGKLFLRTGLRAAVFSLVVLLLCGMAALGIQNYTEGGDAAFSVAIADEDGSRWSRVAIDAVMSRRELAALLSVFETDTESARDGVEEGDYVAAILLPEGYIDGIRYGRDTEGVILLPREGGISGMLLSRLSVIGTRMILAGQWGVFAGADVVNGLPEGASLIGPYTDRANLRLIAELLGSTTEYLTEETEDTVSGTLSSSSQTVLLYVMLFFSLMTVSYYRQTTADMTVSRYARLRAAGVSECAFLSSKVLYAFLLRLLFAVPLSLLLYDSLTLSPVSVASLLFVLFFFSVFGVALSALLSGSRWGVSLLALFHLCEMLLSGAILPVEVLPAPIRLLGAWTPLGCAVRMSYPALGGDYSPLSYLSALVLSCGLWLLACRRLGGRLGGRCARCE